ncbi:uncharacterized protein ALTATR162_LOCUS6578 [Alternaria atra]|uniref:Uncharacterized protein n=1 Tax=Alternaria atra TaxID=119953 RepID=A0A8J2I760_9PLEO|nr:uncharacterized protein ALTATR162_LOCUS6578 [Alternaria atra]CAG5163920.1 unnamed protein product [Alternaria atra]
MVRDPQFWKRFSVAVHQDDLEKTFQDPKQSDSWLAQQQRKAKHRTWICWCFWIIFLLLVAGVVVTVLVLKAHKII